MTNKTTTVQVVATQGRPLSQKGRKTKNAVENFVAVTDSTFTGKDVRKVAKQSKTYVNNRLNAMLRAGTIEKVGTKVQKVGRPVSVYKRVAQA